MQVYKKAAEQWADPDGCARLIRHFETSEGKSAAEKRVGGFLADLSPKTVFDLGCGPGRFVAVLPDTVKTYKGFDTSAGLLEVAEAVHAEDKRVKFFTQDILEGTPLKRPPDVVLLIGITRHYTDPMGLAAAILRKWPAGAYVMDFLHHDGETQDLINGRSLSTAIFEAELPRLGREVIARWDQPQDNRVVSYVVLGDVAPVPVEVVEIEPDA